MSADLVARLSDSYSGAEPGLSVLMRAAEEAAAEITRLREALEPFARYADGVGRFSGSAAIFDLEFESHEIGKRKLTEEDFSRAARAFNGGKS